MPISSSRIRRVIKGGEWEDALQMLGHPYPIRGRVVKGIGQGRRLGWPTINLAWSERKLLPPAGVYACSVAVDGTEYRGMMFIGVNMLNPQNVVSVEAHLFDFNRDLYGAERLSVAFHPAQCPLRQPEVSRQIVG
jgi:riboflavin kinase/FMN adenylyltransferase